MSLDTTTRLPQDKIAEYADDGYLILRNVFSGDDIEMLAAECDTLLQRQELIDTANIRCRWSNHVETDEFTFDCFDPVIDIGPVSRCFAYDERILEPLRSLYADDAHLFKDKLIFKRPGMKGYALHQDYIGWASFPESFVTVI